jgi:hypothetical protein
VLEAVGNHPGVIYAGLLVECFLRVVFADDNRKVAGWINKNLIATNSED